MKQLLISNDSVIKYIFRESFELFVELFKTRINATRYVTFSILICLVTTTNHRNIFTSALDYPQNYVISIGGINSNVVVHSMVLSDDNYVKRCIYTEFS